MYADMLYIIVSPYSRGDVDQVATKQNQEVKAMCIIKFNCSCGNTDTSKAKYYHGLLGYEALICTICGRYSDHTAEHAPDDWSKTYIINQKQLQNEKNQN